MTLLGLYICPTRRAGARPHLGSCMAFRPTRCRSSCCVQLAAVAAAAASRCHASSGRPPIPAPAPVAAAARCAPSGAAGLVLLDAQPGGHGGRPRPAAQPPALAALPSRRPRRRHPPHGRPPARHHIRRAAPLTRLLAAAPGPATRARAVALARRRPAQRLHLPRRRCAQAGPALRPSPAALQPRLRRRPSPHGRAATCPGPLAGLPARRRRHAGRSDRRSGPLTFRLSTARL
jgi:hypothetical protein